MQELWNYWINVADCYDINWHVYTNIVKDKKKSLNSKNLCNAYRVFVWLSLISAPRSNEAQDWLHWLNSWKNAIITYSLITQLWKRLAQALIPLTKLSWFFRDFEHATKTTRVHLAPRVERLCSYLHKTQRRSEGLYSTCAITSPSIDYTALYR